MFDSILADRSLVTDWLKVGTMLVVSRLLAGGALDDKLWMMSSLYTLLGFTTYHLVTKKFVNISVDNEVFNRVINTNLKVGTMLLVSRLLSGQPLSEEWMKASVYTLLGFTAYDVLVKDMVPVEIEHEGLRNTVNDALTVGTMATVSRLLEGGSLSDQKWLMSTAYTIAGFAAYNLGTSVLLN